MNCRSCGFPTHSIFHLGRMPLANSLLNSPNDPYKRYPLELMLCESCSLVQLHETIPPAEMFVDYSYLTSCSPPMIDHARKLVAQVESRIPLGADSLVVEIGSNDGYLLQHYHGIRVLGIDPSKRAADIAAQKGIETYRTFFNASVGESLRGRTDVIHANNVLAHVPDLNDFVSGLALMLKPNGMLIIEVPYLCRLIDKTIFDQFYHEHVYQFSLTSLFHLLSRHGLIISHIEEIDTHGGSLRLWITNSGESDAITEYILSEESHFITSDAYYSDFNLRAEKVRFDTRHLLHNRVVAGFGAAAKATIFLNAVGITSVQMSSIADDTPSKQGKFIPGTGIPVIPVGEWLQHQPDATMILAWNFSHEIAHKYRTLYKGRFFTWYSPELLRSVPA